MGLHDDGWVYSEGAEDVDERFRLKLDELTGCWRIRHDVWDPDKKEYVLFEERLATAPEMLMWDWRDVMREESEHGS